eukprot:scaffold60772_cov35-Phaeocystis_antarctica.AAC.1
MTPPTWLTSAPHISQNTPPHLGPRVLSRRGRAASGQPGNLQRCLSAESALQAGARDPEALRGTLRADAVVPSTPRPVYHQPVSRGQPSGLQTPTVPLKITNEIDFGPIWGAARLRYPVNDGGPMGCALGHCSSSVRRTGTIYGDPDTSHELSFDTCPQRGHQVKSC